MPFHPMKSIAEHRLQPGRARAYLLPCLVIILLTTSLPTLAAERTIPHLHSYISTGGYALAIDGKVARSHNLYTSFVPASILKIFTGLLAIETLGSQYRFTTSFYLDDRKRLFIIGEGDPFLTSEAIEEIALILKSKGLRSVDGIICDSGDFAVAGPPPESANTTNPYDAHSGAVIVNFNAAPFIKKNNGSVLSGETQTPLLPIMQDLAEHVGPGKHRVNVDAFPQATEVSNNIRYAGELFAAIFRMHGIAVSPSIESGPAPPDAQLLLHYRSQKSVADLVRLSLYYSNNLIANQLFLACGKKILDSPATWAKSRKVANDFATSTLQLPHGALRVEDGSGLSSGNSITPAAMLTILEKFRPYSTLLKKRHETRLKSGTLTDVYSYAGYFKNDTVLTPFVLILNQEKNTRKAVLRLMHKEFESLRRKR